MKSISIFLLLFIIKSSISNESIDDYSMDRFINSLKNEGFYETILSIKKKFGQDLAIIICEELNNNSYGNCKRLVKEYMPSFPTIKIIKSDYIIYKKYNINGTLIKKTKYNWDKLKEILRRKFSPEEAEIIAERIIARVEQGQGQRQEQEKEIEKEQAQIN